MSWVSTAVRIGGYALAPFTGGASAAIGEGIAGGLDAKNAAKTATQQQQASTDSAVKRLDDAQRVNSNIYDQTSKTQTDLFNRQGQLATDLYNRQQQTNGDVLNQQRSDFQNVANVPFQTLGQALGINIGNVGPSAITNQAPMTFNPMKASTLAEINNPMQMGPGLTEGPPGGAVLKVGGPPNSNGVLPPAAPGTPIKPNSMAEKDWNKLSMDEKRNQADEIVPQTAIQKSQQSSYKKVQGPDGSVKDVPAEIARLLVKQGLKVVG